MVSRSVMLSPSLRFSSTKSLLRRVWKEPAARDCAVRGDDGVASEGHKLDEKWMLLKPAMRLSVEKVSLAWNIGLSTLFSTRADGLHRW